MVLFIGFTGLVAPSAVSGGGTWVHASGCSLTTMVNIGLDCWYVLSSTSGSTSVVATVTTATGTAIALYEYSFTGSSVSLDDAQNVNLVVGTTASPVNGPSFTITGTNDQLFQCAYISPVGTPTVSVTIYTNTNVKNTSAQNFNVANKDNSTSGTAPSWSWTGGSSAQYDIGGMAFKENGLSTSVPGLLTHGVG